MSNTPKLDQALAALKKRILADLEYVDEHELTASDVLDGFDMSDFIDTLEPLYTAAEEDAKDKTEVQS